MIEKHVPLSLVIDIIIEQGTHACFIGSSLLWSLSIMSAAVLFPLCPQMLSILNVMSLWLYCIMDAQNRLFSGKRTWHIICWSNAWLFELIVCSFFLGWLQSIYGIHTFRVESVAHRKAAPVDELQVQGVSNPGLLRKVGYYLQFFLSASFNDSGTSAIPSFNLLKLIFVTHWTTWKRLCIFRVLACLAGYYQRSFQSHTRCWQKL